MPRSDREALEEALGYQRLTQGMQGRIARVLRGGVDDLLDRMAELCGRYGREIGDPAGAARWLSSMWGPYDEEWLSKYADSLPEPLRGKWEAVLRAPRFDRAISRRKAMAYASRMCMDRIEHDVKEVSGLPLGRVAREASMRTAHQVQTSAGVGFSFELPNQGQVERVMRSSGASKKIKGFSRANVELVEDRVVRGLLAGAGIDDIAAGIRRDFRDMSPARARRIARTMTTDCAAEAKLREYGELGVEEYEIMCTLDERTCPTCGSMDGKAFPVKGSHPRPSFHPNCRCVIVEKLPEDWTDRMTRAARDEGGKTVQVPRSMTYDEWKKQFVKPANAQGSPSKAKAAKKVYKPDLGIKTQQNPSSFKQSAQSGQNVGVLESPKPSGKGTAEGGNTVQSNDLVNEGRKASTEKIDVGKLGNLKGALHGKDYDNVKKALRDSDDLVKRAWKSVGASLKISKTRLGSTDHAKFTPGVGVMVDIREDSKGMSKHWIDPNTGKMRSYSIPPYRAFWHEMGHNMAYAIAERNGMAGPMRDVSTGYVSKVHGCTLDEMIVMEAKALVERRRKELGSVLRKASYDTAYDSISIMLNEMNPEAVVGISDIFNGATKGKIKGPFCHEDSYWNGSKGETPCPAGVEAFAEMTSAVMTNPKALKEIKKYFGQSYEIYEEILREAGDGNL